MFCYGVIMFRLIDFNNIRFTPQSQVQLPPLSQVCFGSVQCGHLL